MVPKGVNWRDNNALFFLIDELDFRINFLWPSRRHIRICIRYRGVIVHKQLGWFWNEDEPFSSKLLDPYKSARCFRCIGILNLGVL